MLEKEVQRINREAPQTTLRYRRFNHHIVPSKSNHLFYVAALSNKKIKNTKIGNMSENVTAGIIRAMDEGLRGRALKKYVIARDHKGIYDDLLAGDKDHANRDLGGPNCRMTCLEYAIYHGEWKMACIFFRAGASPEHNRYSGGLNNLRVIENNKIIPGFAGLYALVNPEVEEANKMNSFIWLMEYTSNAVAGEVPEVFVPRVLSSLRTVCPKHDIADRLQANVKATVYQLSFMGIDRPVILEIVKDVIASTIWSFFTGEIVMERIASRTKRRRLR